MSVPAAAEAINFYPVEQVTQPHLWLVADNGILVETPALPEADPARRRTDQFMGHVAIEGLQAEYDAVTELAELTDGQMRAVLELTFDGHDLYGPDGRSLTETAQKGLKAAREQAKKNPNLWFEVGRRSLELEEVLMAVDMVKSGHANTMIVTTDFPWALQDAEEDVGGYNVTRKQALRRGITVDPNGKILLHSQTLDGSNRKALDAVDAEFGFQTNPNEELLGQRRFLNLSAEEQATIMDRSVAVYDREMSAQFGGVWYAGRRPADYRNTYDFVCRQHDLIDTYKTLKLSGNLTDEIMYNMAATINARFKKSGQGRVESAPQATLPADGLFDATARRPDYSLSVLYEEMRMEGRKAREEGIRFSACGSTWKPEGQEKSTEGLLKLAGYGNNAENETRWHGGKIYKNAKCVSCEKVKEEVGACHICEDCVQHPKKHKLGTVQGRTGDPKKAKINKEPAQVISLDEARKAKEKRQAIAS